jgi:hypothetical protein
LAKVKAKYRNPYDSPIKESAAKNTIKRYGDVEL